MIWMAALTRRRGQCDDRGGTLGGRRRQAGDRGGELGVNLDVTELLGALLVCNVRCDGRRGVRRVRERVRA